MADLERPLTTRFTAVLALAANIHRLQARKGTQVPYMAHILGVAAIALEHGANEEEAIGAILRDAIEDAPKRLGASGVRGAIEEILSDFRIEGIRVFDRFNKEAGMGGTIGYYRGLVIAFRALSKRLEDPRLPRLLNELDRTVTALEQETGVVGKWPVGSASVR